MANRGEIRHGDTVRDTISGLTGVVVAITTWLNGCERITIQPKEIKDGKPVETSTLDTEQLEFMDSVHRREPVKRTGGDRQNITRAADVR